VTTSQPAAAPADVVAALAPSGVLRAAINFGNNILAQRHSSTGSALGITVDLAHALARQLRVPLELVPFESAGKVVEARKSDLWDVAFLAVDPKRGADMLFTAPYVHIEGAYLVRGDSALHEPGEVDRPGLRIGVGRDSAYDLFLTRSLRHATLERRVTPREAYDLLEAGTIDVAAGVRPIMERDLFDHHALRLISPSFMVIEQAMAMPIDRPRAGGEFLAEFVEAQKACGFIAEALKRSGQTDASVAPAVRRHAEVAVS